MRCGSGGGGCGLGSTSHSATSIYLQCMEFSSGVPDPPPAQLPWSESRQAIHEWLLTQSLPLAELYFGAVQVLNNETPGWTRFVAHAIREIVNRLPSAICGEEMVKGNLQYPQRLDILADQWEKGAAAVEETEDPSGMTAVRQIELDVWIEIDTLVQDHRAVHLRNRERALKMFMALIPEAPEDDQRIGWIAGQWIQLGGWAHKKAHDQTRVDHEQDCSEILGRFQSLEGLIQGATRPFFGNREEIDELLAATNS